jgi:nondiscriminating aspartyl-tRNA synthetase
MDITDKIIKLLQDNDITFQLLEHEPTPTSEDSARVRRTSPLEGRKAMILKGKKSGKRIMVVITSNLKIDMKKVKAQMGEEFHFEDPDTILKDFDIEIGGIPPLGNLLGLETYFDRDNLLEKTAAFNCGYKTKSIIMKLDDLIKVVNPIFVDFKKEL